MYYRRKILLSIIQQFGGVISRTELQKLLFLFCQKQKEPSYHFVPYKYGCFSFLANQDITTMINYNQIDEYNSKWRKLDPNEYIEKLKNPDKILLSQLFNNFNDLKGNELLYYIYKNYPYYAINSKVAEKILDNETFKIVLDNKPTQDKNAIFTIGYEGKSAEEYTNLLIKENVKVLCDVRKNPISMKYGFSKNQLKFILENVGIKYIHIPKLGIDSNKRQKLISIDDYNELFEDYINFTLPEREFELNYLEELYLKEKRIALTCFESNFNYCHRSKISEALMLRLDNKFQVQHI